MCGQSLARNEGLIRIQPCLHLHLGLPGIKAVRKWTISLNLESIRAMEAPK